MQFCVPCETFLRYLQQRAFSTNKVICNYHFFNTYFYEKLKEAVSNKVTPYTIFKGVSIVLVPPLSSDCYIFSREQSIILWYQSF